MSNAISCRGLHKRFGDEVILDGFSLEVPEGRIVGLLGPSGSGKTTALRLIAGFERPDAGTVEVAGVTVVDGSTFVPPERRRVGMVFQDFALFPHMTVGANVGYGLAKGASRRVAEVLEMVGLAGMERRLPHELSGGEQQRVALARALAPAPAVILLDEPFSNLDAPQRDRVRREVRNILVEARTTTVFVTHDQAEALAISDVLAVMRAGQVLQTATPNELYSHPTNGWVAQFLGEGSIVSGTAGRGAVETPLGRFPAAVDAVGEVEVLIRPEHVRITADSGGAGLVVTSEYFGHDQLITLHVADGRRLLARSGPLPLFRPGDRVRYEILEAVVLSGSVS